MTESHLNQEHGLNFLTATLKRICNDSFTHVWRLSVYIWIVRWTGKLPLMLPYVISSPHQSQPHIYHCLSSLYTAKVTNHSVVRTTNLSLQSTPYTLYFTFFYTLIWWAIMQTLACMYSYTKIIEGECAHYISTSPELPTFCICGAKVDGRHQVLANRIFYACTL